MLLRSVINHVKSQNWLAVAIDFLIVVAGVFIGIQMSNWNDARNTAAAEAAMLREVHAALVTDAESVEGLLTHYRQVETHAERLLAHMREGQPYEPALDEHFGVLYGFGITGFNRAAYESLKSQGLDLVSDSGLRSHIVRVYEQSYKNAQDAVDSEYRVITDLLEPYFLAHFKDHRFTKSATPLDYETLLKDTRFLNIVDYRLQIVRQHNIPAAEATLAEIEKLIAALSPRRS